MSKTEHDKGKEHELRILAFSSLALETYSTVLFISVALVLMISFYKNILPNTDLLQLDTRDYVATIQWPIVSSGKLLHYMYSSGIRYPKNWTMRKEDQLLTLGFPQSQFVDYKKRN